jgi:hypothetical protein
MHRRARSTLCLLALLSLGAAAADGPLPSTADAGLPYGADGRLPAGELLERVDALRREHGWRAETVHAYPDGAAIRAWRTAGRGPALWIIAGIHGEEPAGPNALAGGVEPLAALARAGVPMVVIPLANPRAYGRNWRYPNTAERDWLGPGYSVGDSEHLLPDLGAGTRVRAAAAKGPETAALTGYVLGLASDYPPLLALDLHEDALATEGYVYIQAPVSGRSAVADEVVRLLQANGTPLLMSGKTRFGEPVERGLSTRDAEGRPFRDGSIDELVSAPWVFRDGARIPGPSGRTVLVVETPADAATPLGRRVAAHAAILARIAELWRLAGGPLAPTPAP